MGGPVKWKSHVLISNSGFAFKTKGRKKTNIFLPWTEFKTMRKKTPSLSLSPHNAQGSLHTYVITPIFSKEFENRQKFQNRINILRDLMYELWSKTQL